MSVKHSHRTEPSKEEDIYYKKTFILAASVLKLKFIDAACKQVFAKQIALWLKSYYD